MKDIPVFDTPYGVASLVLREIPYRGRAYMKIQSAWDPEKLLEECVGFCRACGAEWIEAAGDDYLTQYPKVATLITMQRDLAGLPKTSACLIPVAKETLPQWLEIYNQRMAEVPNAAWMDTAEGKALLKAGDGYFVQRDEKLLGIGKASGDRVDAVISVVPGAGETVVLALAGILTGDLVQLTVADTNPRAVRLYERMGFMQVAEEETWYRVL